MKRRVAFLAALLLLFCAVSASAQTITCPSAGFSFTLPDRFSEIPRSPSDDQDLVLHLSDRSVDLTVYVSFASGMNPFIVLTGDELEYGPVTENGVEMYRIRGRDSQSSWLTYSWMYASSAVSIYFVWSGDDRAALSLVDEIMSSVSFR